MAMSKLTRQLQGAQILITGGAGFISTNFIASVIDRCKVVVLDSLARNCLSTSPLSRHRNLTMIQGDVQDARVVARAVAGADYVLHMAAIAGVGTVVNNPARTLHVNLLGTYNVLGALQRQNSARRFIDFSTSEVYGPHVFRANEQGMTTQGSVYQPRWFYAVSKLASEFLTRAYHLEFGLPTACIRPFNVYGPHQLGEGAIRNFVMAALQGQPLIVHGEGEQIRSWCYVSDMVDAITACLVRKEAIGHHFNIGNPRATTSTLELARMIIRLAGSKSRIVFRKIKYPDVEVRVPSIREAERALGFRPLVDIEPGLVQTIDWYRRYLKVSA